MLGLTAIVFLAVLIGILAIGIAVDSRSSRARTLRQRLQGVDAAERRGPNPETALLRNELLSEIPALNRVLERWSRSSRLQLLLEQADLKLRAGKFLLISACAAGATAFLMLALTHNPLFALLGLLLGACIPLWVAFLLRKKRFRKFEALFPQAIELLVRSARAGHPFTSSLEMMATEMSEPIAGEFRRVYEEQKFGLPMRDALLNLAVRVPIIDVKFFVTSVMLQRETGGNLTEILDKLAYVIRERFRLLRQVRVYTAQGRLTLMILMSLPPGLVLLWMVINPVFIKPLLTDPMGHFLIGAGVTMQLIGYFVIRRIIDIKV